jgi:hypothetical protein
LVGSTDTWEGFRESRRCSRDTYPESYITKYTQHTKRKYFKVFAIASEADLAPSW